MKDILKCYVSGQKENKKSKRGVISFAVPEYGILFRCGIDGGMADLNVIALLTFLRFAEHNREIFIKRELHIYSDFPLLVYLMNEGSLREKGLEVVRRQAQKYARGFVYKVKWISRTDNRAAGSVNEIPVMPTDSKIKIKSFTELKPGEKSLGLKEMLKNR
jgi:hypothetical protein